MVLFSGTLILCGCVLVGYMDKWMPELLVCLLCDWGKVASGPCRGGKVSKLK